MKWNMVCRYIIKQAVNNLHHHHHPDQKEKKKEKEKSISDELEIREWVNSRETGADWVYEYIEKGAEGL